MTSNNPSQFQFIPFLSEKWKYYIPIFGFLGFALINQSDPLSTLIRLFFLACSILFLITLLKEASDRVNHSTQVNEKGELYLFYVFQFLLIIVLIYNEVKPDPHGVTTLPSFFLCLVYVVMVKILSTDRPIDKSRLMSWIFVGLILCTDLFILSFFSIYYLKDHILLNENSDALLYYWANILPFSFAFGFIGGLCAYLSMFSLNYDSVKSIRFFEYIFEENIPKNRVYLNIVAGFSFLLLIIVISIIYQITQIPT